MISKRKLKGIFKDLLKQYDIVLKGPDMLDGSSCAFENGKQTIYLDIHDNPIESLAHEIGHIALGHTAMKANEVTGQFFLDSEIDAWLFAEEVCRAKGLFFNYRWAIECYGSHVDMIALRELWGEGKGKYKCNPKDLREEWKYEEA